MHSPAIIDALCSIPGNGTAQQITDCIPYGQDLSMGMSAAGITAAVLAPRQCMQCQHEWNCADRRTHEVCTAVERNPQKLRGLACYDPLRIGESLRWISEGVTEGRLAGAYVQSECCVSGLDSARMYPLYGVSAQLSTPVVVGMTSHQTWTHHAAQLELIAADFPELELVIAMSPKTDFRDVSSLLARFPRISLMLCPQALEHDAALLKYVELEGRERALFRSSEGWQAAVASALRLQLRPAAQRAYLSENCMRLFGFPADVSAC